MTIKEFIDAGYQITVKYNNRTFWSATVDPHTINTDEEDFAAFTDPVAEDSGPDTIDEYIIWGPKQQDGSQECIADRLTYKELKETINKM